MKFLDLALEVTDGLRGRGRLAIDLGCGSGNETLVLIEHGWNVLAVDAEPRAIEILSSRLHPDQEPQLETRIGRFHETDLPVADLVFASLSLPFAGEHLEAAIDAARGAVKPGGWFVGVLFGHSDDWADEPDVATVDYRSIEQAFVDFERLQINEEEFNGPSGAGPKHWHWYIVSARRPESGP